jgi:hypothetical protein
VALKRVYVSFTSRHESFNVLLIITSNIRDLASRLDGMLGHLTGAAGQRSIVNTNSETHSPTSLQTPISANTDHGDEQQGMVYMRKPEQHRARRTSISRGNWADRLGLDRWLLGHLLQRYRTMQHHFPFVVIPQTWDVQHMLVSRPMLLLAVVSSSACQHSQLQQILVQDLKDTLNRRVTVGGENSLELLQAVLIHLAW